jgi:hypothetical protein
LGYTRVDVNVTKSLSHYMDLGAGGWGGEVWGGESQYDKAEEHERGGGRGALQGLRGPPRARPRAAPAWGAGGITVEGLVEVLRETRTQGVVQHCQLSPQDTRETG